MKRRSDKVLSGSNRLKILHLVHFKFAVYMKQIFFKGNQKPVSRRVVMRVWSVWLKGLAVPEG